MIFVLAALFTVTGVASSYVAAGMARSTERRRGNIECEERLELLRRQSRRRV